MDDIAIELAREEHRQGIPVGIERDHCGRCRTVHVELLRARCPHDGETVDMSTLAGPLFLYCLDCGARVAHG